MIKKDKEIKDKTREVLMQYIQSFSSAPVNYFGVDFKKFDNVISDLLMETERNAEIVLVKDIWEIIEDEELVPPNDRDGKYLTLEENYYNNALLDIKKKLIENYGDYLLMKKYNKIK